ncbi:MAG: hypothetical protein VW946_00435 [Gammaproteobacteria bacterium]
MNTKSRKKYSLVNFMGILASIAYGFFVVASLQRLYSSGSGDIAALLDFFDNIDIFVLSNNYNVFSWDGLFRLLVVFLGNFFQTEYVNVLSGIAFVTSTISFRIITANIKSSNDLIHLLPLLVMVFFSPNVVNLYASGVRSGIAFTILLFAILQHSILMKYFLFGLSSLVHLSMAPIISLYLLFRVLRHRRINASSLLCYFMLITLSSSLAIFAYIYQYNVTPVSSSFYFNVLIFCLALLIVLSSKKSIKNIYGFISIGLIVIVVIGNFLDISFSRYVGNALILYLFFLIKEPNVYVIRVFSLGYAPFFILTMFYSIANQL